MSIGDAFKKIGKGVLGTADAGARLNVPVLSQIDQVADAVKGIQTKRKVDAEQVSIVLAGLAELKATAGTLPDAKSRRKLIGLVIGVIAMALAPHLGLSPEQAKELSDNVSDIVMLFIAVQGTIDGVTAFRQ